MTTHAHTMSRHDAGIRRVVLFDVCPIEKVHGNPEVWANICEQWRQHWWDFLAGDDLTELFSTFLAEQYGPDGPKLVDWEVGTPRPDWVDFGVNWRIPDDLIARWAADWELENPAGFWFQIDRCTVSWVHDATGAESTDRHVSPEVEAVRKPADDLLRAIAESVKVDQRKMLSAAKRLISETLNNDNVVARWVADVWGPGACVNEVTGQIHAADDVIIVPAATVAS